MMADHSTEVESQLDTTWMAEGKCRELAPETFFPSDGVGVEVARRICAECPVKSPCLEYALYNRIEHGVWGGASERERRRIARQRRGGPRPAIEEPPPPADRGRRLIPRGRGAGCGPHGAPRGGQPRVARPLR